MKKYSHEHLNKVDNDLRKDAINGLKSANSPREKASINTVLINSTPSVSDLYNDMKRITPKGRTRNDYIISPTNIPTFSKTTTRVKGDNFRQDTTYFTPRSNAGLFFDLNGNPKKETRTVLRQFYPIDYSNYPEYSPDNPKFHTQTYQQRAAPSHYLHDRKRLMDIVVEKTKQEIKSKRNERKNTMVYFEGFTKDVSPIRPMRKSDYILLGPKGPILPKNYTAGKRFL